jgi:oligopeptide transport system ATP-binding protein
MKIRDIVGEPLVVHRLARSRADYRRQVAELLDMVGLNPRTMDRFPHEFSGGQRQRIGIARALAVKPAFIVCDEAVSALDVSIQAQIINLLENLQEQLGLTFLFIAHDLAVVRHISHEIAVMYLGRIVEIASRHDLFQTPLHPYTQALLSAVPIPDPRLEARRRQILLPGETPLSFDPRPGCRFHSRCPRVLPHCASQAPAMVEATPGHQVACHRATSQGTEVK